VLWTGPKKNENNEDPCNTMPLDMIRYIFAWAKGDLATIASVSKTWKAIAYNQDFRNGIGLPTEHFLNNDVWKKLPGVDVKEEPYLPLCIYRDVGPKDFLGLVHKTVKIDGVEMKIGPKLLGELAAKLIKGLNQTGFHEHCWPKAINEHQGSETLHWVWIKADATGKGECFSKQKKIAREAGGVVSEYFDTLVCLFLDRIKSEKPEFNWDKDTWIRVADKIGDWRIWIGFASSGLNVRNSPDLDHPRGDVCVAVARNLVIQEIIQEVGKMIG
jgi:hypothetical protein